MEFATDVTVAGTLTAGAIVGNLTGNADTATDSTKLPLAGGAMTGSIDMGGSDVTGAKRVDAALITGAKRVDAALITGPVPSGGGAMNMRGTTYSTSSTGSYRVGTGLSVPTPATDPEFGTYVYQFDYSGSGFGYFYVHPDASWARGTVFFILTNGGSGTIRASFYDTANESSLSNKLMGIDVAAGEEAVVAVNMTSDTSADIDGLDNPEAGSVGGSALHAYWDLNKDDDAHLAHTYTGISQGDPQGLAPSAMLHVTATPVLNGSLAVIGFVAASSFMGDLSGNAETATTATTANDPTKLPLAGGTVTGNIALGPGAIIAPSAIDLGSTASRTIAASESGAHFLSGAQCTFTLPEPVSGLHFKLTWHSALNGCIIYPESSDHHVQGRIDGPSASALYFPTGFSANGHFSSDDNNGALEITCATAGRWSVTGFTFA